MSLPQTLRTRSQTLLKANIYTWYFRIEYEWMGRESLANLVFGECCVREADPGLDRGVPDPLGPIVTLKP